MAQVWHRLTMLSELLYTPQVQYPALTLSGENDALVRLFYYLVYLIDISRFKGQKSCMSKKLCTTGMESIKILFDIEMKNQCILTFYFAVP